MKASKLQMMKNLMLVKAFIKEGFDFVPMPVTSEAHRAQLTEQALSSVAAESVADAINDDDEGMPNVLNVPATILKDAMTNLYKEVKRASADSGNGILYDGTKVPDGVGLSEVRGFGKLGFNDGVGLILMATDNKATYDSAHNAEYPTDSEPCSNPACQACHGAKASSPVTSETKH